MKVVKIPALNRIEILGYLADTSINLSVVKKIKDLAELREKFRDYADKDDVLLKNLKENDDIDRYKILKDFKEIEVKEVQENQPVFNFKRVLKFILENRTTSKSVLNNWIIKKENILNLFKIERNDF